jgi:hypothetical protein
MAKAVELSGRRVGMGVVTCLSHVPHRRYHRRHRYLQAGRYTPRAAVTHSNMPEWTVWLKRCIIIKSYV